MRRVSFVNGIKQRLNEMLGRASGSDATGDMKAWSLQGAMLTNLKRIVSSMVGDAQYGRPMKGLWLAGSIGSSTVTVSSGAAFTPNGDIIVIDKSLDIDVTSYVSVTRYVYVKHVLTVMEESVNPDGLNTPVNGKVNSEIVADDLGAYKGTSIVTGEIITVETSKSANADWVYLGDFTTDGSGQLTADPINSTERGPGPNSGPLAGTTSIEKMIVDDVTLRDGGAIDVISNSGITMRSGGWFNFLAGSFGTLSGAYTISSTCVLTFASGSNSNFASGSTVDFSGAVEVNGGGAGNIGLSTTVAGPLTSITVKNGIVTALS